MIYEKYPRLQITYDDAMALPEYSGTVPTGATPGKRWRRHNGIFTTRIRREHFWIIGEYDPEFKGGKHININWYRPVIRVKAVGRKL